MPVSSRKGVRTGVQVQTERDLAAQIEEEAAGAVEELETELEACRLSAEREIEQARQEAADAAGRASSSAARWVLAPSDAT